MILCLSARGRAIVEFKLRIVARKSNVQNSSFSFPIPDHSHRVFPLLLHLFLTLLFLSILFLQTFKPFLKLLPLNLIVNSAVPTQRETERQSSPVWSFLRPLQIVRSRLIIDTTLNRGRERKKNRDRYL